jgi:hypothetical protein
MMIRLATFLLLAATTTAAAQPLPQPKVVVCPVRGERAHAACSVGGLRDEASIPTRLGA